MTDGEFPQNTFSSISLEAAQDFLHFVNTHNMLPDITPDTLRHIYNQMSESEVVEYYRAIYLMDDENKRIAIEKGVPKPKKLYHASQQAGITVFEPRQEKKRHPDEPAQIFATPSEKIATMFIVPADDTLSISGAYNGVWTYIIGDEKKFNEFDKGGCIYELPSDTFTVNPYRGLGLFEWTSTTNTTPKAERQFTSGLDAMKKAGIKIYIVDAQQFKQLKESNDAQSILETLTPAAN